VIVNGHAYSPTGEPVQEVDVILEIGSIKKHIRVVGDRHWRKRVFRLRPSPPTPFVKMPLVFDRAFGGSDHSHKKPKYHGTELRNPVGVGFHKNTDSKTIRGTPLPNLEHPRHRIRRYRLLPISRAPS
jgi:hypothetical protein